MFVNSTMLPYRQFGYCSWFSQDMKCLPSFSTSILMQVFVQGLLQESGCGALINHIPQSLNLSVRAPCIVWPPHHLEILEIRLDFHFELACPILAGDAKDSWVLKSVNKTFDFIRLSVCLRHLFFDNSSVVLIGPATPSLLMHRFQECQGQKQPRTNVLFLAPLVLLSYIVQEWRKVLSWSLDEAMILESHLKDPNKVRILLLPKSHCSISAIPGLW